MVKKKQRRKSKELPILDQDDVYDEIDQFHNERDNSTLNFITHKQKPLIKEVLSVKVDDEDDEYNLEAITKKKLKDLNETTNKWGRKQKNFYGTSYVDQDFGGINNSDEEELLNLEENDALRRQKKQDAVLNYVNFEDFVDNSENFDENCLNFKVDRPKEDNFYVLNKTLHKKKIKKQNEETLQKNTDENEELKEESLVNDENSNNFDFSNKRAVTYKIMKNKGLTAKRRKDSKHARIKNRKLYGKALIRKRSQIPDVRRELTKYDGEKRGIRMSTIRSIKLQ